MYKRGELNISFKLVKGFTQSRKVFAQSSQRFSCINYKIFNGRIIVNQNPASKERNLIGLFVVRFLQLKEILKLKKLRIEILSFYFNLKLFRNHRFRRR